jgi:hypothetical protein
MVNRAMPANAAHIILIGKMFGDILLTRMEDGYIINILDILKNVNLKKIFKKNDSLITQLIKIIYLCES